MIRIENGSQGLFSNQECSSKARAIVEVLGLKWVDVLLVFKLITDSDIAGIRESSRPSATPKHVQKTKTRFDVNKGKYPDALRARVVEAKKSGMRISQIYNMIQAEPGPTPSRSWVNSAAKSDPGAEMVCKKTVMSMFGTGLSIKEIAVKLGVSEHDVRLSLGIA